MRRFAPCARTYAVRGLRTLRLPGPSTRTALIAGFTVSPWEARRAVLLGKQWSREARRRDNDGPLAPVDDPRFGAGTKSPWAAEVNGFNIHAGVMVRAGDREGLERLCRYGARPPFRLERMSLLPDGRVAYLLRKPRRNGATHLVLDPVHFLARISALVPPPRYPLTRLAGVLAPHSTWRDAVVKYGRDETTAPPAPAAEKRGKKKEKKKTDVSAAEARVPSGPRTSLGAAIVKPVGARIDWASLLRHVYLEDVLS